MLKTNPKIWDEPHHTDQKVIHIEPVTRLEGHAKIDIFLDDKGNVQDAYFQVVELRGFEEFCRGRPAEEEIDGLLALREPLYRELATLTVDTDGRRPGEAAAFEATLVPSSVPV